MPTGAKLVAALCLGVLGFLLSEQVKPLFPEGTAFGSFSLLNAGIGVVVGWVVLGRRAGLGWAMAITNGLTAAAALVFWGLFVQAAREMTRLAMRNRYDGPVEALSDVFRIGVDYGAMMLVPQILTTFAIGGIVAGILTEMAGRAWR